jgi:hypothetical protein
MPISKAMQMVWEIRDKLDEELALMTPAQRRRYLRKTAEKAMKESALKLRTVKAGSGSKQRASR